jgi:hypothetical protein
MKKKTKKTIIKKTNNTIIKKTNNTMIKNKQYNDKKQTIQ